MHSWSPSLEEGDTTHTRMREGYCSCLACVCVCVCLIPIHRGPTPHPPTATGGPPMCHVLSLLIVML